MYCSAVEMAFASVSRTRLKTISEKGDPRAKRALRITENMDRAITTILITTNIIHLAAASLVTVLVTRRFGASAVVVSTLLTTLAVFFFGEMLPKSAARKYSERICLASAGSLSFLMTVLRPLSALLTKIGKGAASLTKGDAETTITEDELIDMIEDMTEEGTLDEEQGDLITSALQFGDTPVESIVTSRVDVAGVDITKAPGEVLAFIRSQNHSRLPVYEGTIDHIVGILQIRRFIKAFIDTDGKPDIRTLLDEPCFVHQSTRIDDLLKIMSKGKINMAVVTDNYGGTLGIVTVEDILEELVGEIWDEDDRIVENIVPIAGGAYSVNAEEQVTDVFDELDIEIPDEDEEELANKLMSEFVFEHFDRIPEEGDSFEYGGCRIEVLSMKSRRIYRLKVTPMKAEEPGKEAQA